MLPETSDIPRRSSEGNSNSATSAAFLRQLRGQNTEPLTVIWDNSPAHWGEAIWGWVRQEVTANLCLGTRAAVREKVVGFFADLAHRQTEVKRCCRTEIQARAQAITGAVQAPSPHTDHVDFSLASV